MKKLRLTKIISCSLVVASVLSLNPIGVSAEWKQDSSGWWNTEGNSYSIGWRQLDGKWYYFDQNGYMEHDTTVNDYILGSDGAWTQSESSSENEESTSTNQCESNSEDVTMKTEKSIYELGTEEIKFYFTNDTNCVVGFGTGYEVERFENDTWNTLTSDEEFTDSYITMDSNKTESESCKLNQLQDFSELTQGKYRIVKAIQCYSNITDNSTEEICNSCETKYLTAEFELE